jgi:hypothetical protein
MSVDHVILTRFNLPSRGPESLIRAQDGWLQRRVELFERYTIPSVVAQTTAGVRWVVYFDPQSPQWLLDRLAPYVKSGVYTPLFREEAAWRDVGDDVRQVTGARASMLITTNLDNDDALAVNFVERIQALIVPGQSRALFLERGLIASGGRAYIRRHEGNAFCSVAEPWSAQPATTWRDWHMMLGSHMPVISLGGEPAWLQLIHGENVSNRVRGRLVDPRRYSARFSGLLDDLPRVAAGAVAADLVAHAPLRLLREGVRSATKRIIYAIGGKHAVHRVSTLLRRHSA